MDGSIHPGPDTAVQCMTLDGTSYRWVDNEPEEEDIDLEKYYKNVQEEEQRFIRAMETYQKEADPKSKRKTNLKRTHTMEQVWKMMDAAADEYKLQDKKGPWDRVRNAFRKFGENTDAMKVWLGLLPTESMYFSTVSGGLKLILEAAARLNKIREEIFDALYQIPTILNSIDRLLAIYKSSERLNRNSSALFVSILHAMAHILQFFHEKSLRKVVMATLQQTSFQSELSEKLDNMRRCSEAFNNEVVLCNNELLKKTQQVGENTNRVTKSIYQEVREVKEIQMISYEKITQRMIAAEETNKMLEAKMGEMVATLNQAQALLLSSPWVHEASRVELVNSDDTKIRQAAIANVQTTDTTQQYLQIILSRLSYDKDSTRSDVRVNIKLGMFLPLREQDRCVHVIRSPQLTKWTKTINSAILLVNGNSPNIQPRSLLTFVCAKFADSLHQIRQLSTETRKRHVLTVYFFCGEHIDVDDNPNNTPCGIANSILAQLLKQCKNVDLTPVIKLGDFRNNDVDSVCKRIGKLLSILPPDVMVFCIVDGLSYYLDDEQRERDSEKLLGWLVKFTKSQRRGRKIGKQGCVFKLLLTAHNCLQSDIVDEFHEDVLDVPINLPTGGGFTDMNWEMGAGQHIGKLLR